MSVLIDGNLPAGTEIVICSGNYNPEDFFSLSPRNAGSMASAPEILPKQAINGAPTRIAVQNEPAANIIEAVGDVIATSNRGMLEMMKAMQGVPAPAKPAVETTVPELEKPAETIATDVPAKPEAAAPATSTLSDEDQRLATAMESRKTPGRIGDPPATTPPASTVATAMSDGAKTDAQPKPKPKAVVVVSDDDRRAKLLDDKRHWIIVIAGQVGRDWENDEVKEEEITHILTWPKFTDAKVVDFFDAKIVQRKLWTACAEEDIKAVHGWDIAKKIVRSRKTDNPITIEQVIVELKAGQIPAGLAIPDVDDEEELGEDLGDGEAEQRIEEFIHGKTEEVEIPAEVKPAMDESAAMIAPQPEVQAEAAVPEDLSSFKMPEDIVQRLNEFGIHDKPAFLTFARGDEDYKQSLADTMNVSVGIIELMANDHPFYTAETLPLELIFSNGDPAKIRAKFETCKAVMDEIAKNGITSVRTQTRVKAGHIKNAVAAFETYFPSEETNETTEETTTESAE